MSKLKKYREKAGLKRSELALKLNKSTGAIGHYENGIRTPDLDLSREIVKIINECGVPCSLDDVFPPKKKKAA